MIQIRGCMKFLSKALLAFTLLLISINASALKVKADEMLLLSSMSSNKTSHFVVKNKDIEGLPAWNGEGSAPLSIEAATKLAISKHKEKFSKAKLKSISLKSKKTHCGKSLSCPKSLWYYKAKVKGKKKKTYIILMDGSFVKPKST